MDQYDTGPDFNEAHGWADVWTGGDDLLTPEKEAELLADAPQPMLWRVLIRPKSPKRVSAGGIVLASQAKDAETYLQHIGRVVALGPLAGKSERYRDPDDSTKLLHSVNVGDWVCYGRYAGQRIVHRGLRLLVVNDDEILARVTEPDVIRVYV